MDHPKHHVIFIPGIGDTSPHGQKLVIQLWRLFGLTPHYLALNWAKKEGYEAKLQRLLEKIDSLSKTGSVSLVGASAGASAVLNAFAASPDVAKVVCISGKINHEEVIQSAYYAKVPDFEGSMAMLSQSLVKINERQLAGRIMSIHPHADQTVPIEDTIIPGAVEVRVPGRTHITGIAYGLLWGLRMYTRFLKAA